MGQRIVMFCVFADVTNHWRHYSAARLYINMGFPRSFDNCKAINQVALFDEPSWES